MRVVENEQLIQSQVRCARDFHLANHWCVWVGVTSRTFLSCVLITNSSVNKNALKARPVTLLAVMLDLSMHQRRLPGQRVWRLMHK